METKEYVPVEGYEDYIIATSYPYEVINKKNNRRMSEYMRNNGWTVHLTKDKKVYHVDKHIIVAKMFLPNDDPERKHYVARINKDRDDYRLENLFWSASRKLPYALRAELVKERNF